MVWQLDILLLTLIVICAIAAIVIRDLLTAVLVLCMYSLFMCVLWVAMNALDVALTEAAVGAGITTVLFVTAIFATTRRAED